MADYSPVTYVYDLDYFTGSQMFLYVGDVWLDEVTSLQYVTRQTKRPIFGYASQLWDDCAAGQVLVQGQFTINYKEQGYLWAVLRRFKNIDSATAFAGAEGIKRAAFKDRRLTSPDLITRSKLNRKPVWGSNATRIDRRSIERVVQGDVSRGDAYDFYTDLAGYSTFNVNSPRDKVFEDIAEEFEDQIWSRELGNKDLTNQIRRTDDNAFDGFDIFVVFGNYSNPKANHTVQKIVNVRLISQGKVIKIDGEPIQESYEFIARTVV
jgi:hypothetical protein